MPKLHELLAIDGSHKSQADKTRNELIATFRNKVHLFGEKTESYRPFKEGAEAVVEKQLDIQTTVKKELKWISEFLVQSLDVSYQVAEANTIARADILRDDGSVLLPQIPVTSLLELEKRGKELREFIAAIPTLDPAKGFRPDPDKEAGVYRARDEKKARTKKTNVVLVRAPATEKLQAVTDVVVEDVPVGEITTMEWSGLITTAAKGDMLSRAEEFTRAVKQARSRANAAEVPKPAQKIGAVVIGYVFGDLK